MGYVDAEANYGSRKKVWIAAALAAGAVLGMVPLVLDAGRAVRANLSLDAGLLNAIDEAAKAHGLTKELERSQRRLAKLNRKTVQQKNDDPTQPPGSLGIKGRLIEGRDSGHRKADRG